MIVSHPQDRSAMILFRPIFGRCKPWQMGLISVAILFFAGWHWQVPTEISIEDSNAIDSLLSINHIPLVSKLSAAEDEFRFISKVQHAVLKRVSNGPGILKGQGREPATLWKIQEGLCYDRSRFIEKTLEHSGFKVRHVFLIKNRNLGQLWPFTLFRSQGTHAVTEVQTKAGWLVVGSNTPWLSLDANGKVWSGKEIEGLESMDKVKWHPELSTHPDVFFQSRFKVIYGLYSRHGEFYPPYDRIPDVYWPDFIKNFY